MSVRKIKSSWWVDFRFNHIRYRKRSPENSKAGAQAYEARLRNQLAKGESLEFKVEKKKIPTFKEFSEKWFEVYVKNNNKPSEILNKKIILKAHLVPFFEKSYLSEIKNFNIEEYKSLKIKKGLKNKTINNHLAVLSKCFSIAKEWEVIDKIPVIKHLKVPPQKFDYLTVEESKTILNLANGWLKELILLALRTGLRFGELVALDWSDVNFEQKMLTVRRASVKGIMGSTKSNKIRYIPIAQDLFKTLNKRKKNKGFIFSNPDYRPFSHQKCYKALKALCRRNGFRKFTWHTLRHSFASHLAQNGISIQAIQKLLGHSDIVTTMRYAHLSPSTLQGAIDTLNDKIGQPVGNR